MGRTVSGQQLLGNQKPLSSDQLLLVMTFSLAEVTVKAGLCKGQLAAFSYIVGI